MRRTGRSVKITPERMAELDRKERRVDELAKKLCRAAGHDDIDAPVSLAPAIRIGTPYGTAYRIDAGSAQPLWTLWRYAAASALKMAKDGK